MKKLLFMMLAGLIACYLSTAQNVGIGTTNPTRAKLEIKGMVGNSSAVFGGGTEAGIGLVSNLPGVFFNGYYNGGIKSLAPGPVGLITLNNNSQFQFDFAGTAANADQTVSNTTKLLLGSDGKMSVNMSSLSNRAAFEQQGSISVNTAIFGGDGKGVSMQKDWPAIGLNHYFNGNHLSIGGGYGAQIGLDQSTGALYFAQFSNSAPLANGLLLNPISAINFKYGKIGLNTNDPQAPLHIHNTIDAYGNNGANSVNAGLRFSTYATSTFWNVYNFLDLLFWSNGTFKSQISYIDGTYYSNSDKRLKKQIRSIDNDVMQKLNLLNPVSYLMLEENDNTTLRHLGFLAQELEATFPEVVRDGPDGMKSVNYAGLVPVLTKAIQEQQKIIEKQQQQIDWLMKKLR
jgi:hypothetical protein